MPKRRWPRSPKKLRRRRSAGLLNPADPVLHTWVVRLSVDQARSRHYVAGPLGRARYGRAPVGEVPPRYVAGDLLQLEPVGIARRRREAGVGAERLRPEEIHQQVCWLLEPRRTILSVGLQWHAARAGVTVHDLSLENLLHVLRWVTIKPQPYRLGDGKYLLVPFGPPEGSPYLTPAALRTDLVEGLAEAALPLVPTAERAEALPIIRRFHQDFFGKLLAPARRGGDDAAEYKTVLADIRELKLPRSRAQFASAVESRLEADRQLPCRRRTYYVPPKWQYRPRRPGEGLRRVDPDRLRPSGLAWVLLGHKWRCHPQTAKERVVRAGTEAKIDEAWRRYGESLLRYPNWRQDLLESRREDHGG